MQKRQKKTKSVQSANRDLGKHLSKLIQKSELLFLFAFFGKDDSNQNSF